MFDKDNMLTYLYTYLIPSKIKYLKVILQWSVLFFIYEMERAYIAFVVIRYGNVSLKLSNIFFGLNDFETALGVRWVGRGTNLITI